MSSSPHGIHRFFDRIVSGTLSLCVVLLAVSVAYRTFVAPPRAKSTQDPPEHISDAEWRYGLSVGHPMAAARHARVTILEVADLQCPVCRGFQTTLDQVTRDLGDTVSILNIPFPLTYHPQALAAAQAGECAAEVGRYPEWVRAVYDHQDALGTKSWGDFASLAGIADTTMIAGCAITLGPVPKARLANAVSFADRAGVSGTPTLIINGWRLSSAPSVGQLETMARDFAAGREPFGTSVLGKIRRVIGG